MIDTASHDLTFPHDITRRHLFVWCVSLCGFGCSQRKPAEDITPRELPTQAKRLSLVRFSHDGQLLAAADANGGVIVWRKLDDLPQSLDSGHPATPVSLTWSPDGLLAISDLQRGFTGWQFRKSEAERIELPGLPAPAVCVAFRPNHSALEMVIGLRDGSLVFLGSTGLEQIKPDHRGPVKQALYLADGKSLITAGADGQLIWRDASSRKVQAKVKAHDSEINRMSLNASGDLATGDWNGRIQVWDSRTRKSKQSWQQPEGVSGLSWLGTQLVSGGWDGTLRVWSSSGTEVRVIRTEQTVHDLSVREQTRQIVTVGLDRFVRLWQLPSE